MESNYQKFIQALVLAAFFIPTIGCAEKPEEKDVLPSEKLEAQRSTTQANVKMPEGFLYEIGKQGQILSLINHSDGSQVVEIHSTKPPLDRNEMTDWIIWGLETSKVDKDFLSAMRERLPNSRRLDKSDFTLTLTDLDEKAYLVKYNSDIENRDFAIRIQH